MAKGSWTGTALSAIIVAADANREYLTIILTNNVTVALAFGEAAVAVEGIQLLNAGDSVRVQGHLARGAVYAIGNTGAGSYQSEQLELV